MSDNHFWTTKPGQGYGLITDFTDGTFGNSVIDSSMYIGIWLAPGSQRWDVRGNRILATIPVIDQGTGNLI